MATTEITLKARVEACRKTLNDIGVKSARHYFKMKYPEYKKDDNRLDNLWYSKIEDEAFTKQLEAFTVFKQVQFQ